MPYYIFIRAQNTAFDYGGNGDWSDGAPSVNVDQERGKEGRRRCTQLGRHNCGSATKVCECKSWQALFHRVPTAVLNDRLYAEYPLLLY